VVAVTMADISALDSPAAAASGPIASRPPAGFPASS
jgi:hypothetical protein